MIRFVWFWVSGSKGSWLDSVLEVEIVMVLFVVKVEKMPIAFNEFYWVVLGLFG